MERRGTEDFSARSGPSTRELNERPARFALWRRVFLDLALSQERRPALDRLIRGGGVLSSVSPSPTRGRYMRYCNIQGVFHRLGGGGGASRGLGRGDGVVRLSRERLGPVLGMGWNAGSWGVRWSSLGVGSSLGHRDDDGPVEGEDSTSVSIVSRGRYHMLL